MACTPGDKKCIGDDLYVCGVSFDTNLMTYVTGWHFSQSNAPECVVEPPPEEEEEPEEPVYIPPIGPPWELPPMPEPTLPSTARFAFMDWIRERLVGVFTFFFSIYAETAGWIWPFYLISAPFYQLYQSFVYITMYWINFTEWVDEVWTIVERIWTSEGILGLINWWFPALADVIQWFSDRWSWFVSVVGDWWDSTKTTVLGWIDIATEGFNAVKVWWDEFWTITWPQWVATLEVLGDEVSNFFTQTLPDLYDHLKLENWFNGKLFAIDGLIGSKLVEWFPFYNDMAEFFSDPGEFLLAKLADWFLGEEE